MAASVTLACSPAPGTTKAPGGTNATAGEVDPSTPAAASEDPLDQAIASRDAVAVYEQLEAEIEAGEVGKKRRQRAYEAVVGWDDQSADYAFARAALAGRVAESRGLAALDMVEETEKWARTAIDRDPTLREGAAQRMLGTLYVLAGKHTEHGDSEEGLELLEAQAERHPDAAVNHLRLAEGYISLGDPEGAFEPLCRAQAGRDTLGGRDVELLERLLAEVGGVESLECAP